MPVSHLKNIFYTNIQDAYNLGRFEKTLETRETRPYLMYDAINDSRVRPSHLAMDNVIRRWDDPFWETNYPPNGYMCRCRCITLSEAQAQARSGFDKDGDGKGLNKLIDWAKMQPDKGWDYHSGADLLEGAKRAISKRESLANEKGNQMLINSLKSKLTSNPSPPVSKALKLPTKNGFAKQAAQAALIEIDKIHGDGNLPVIPLKGSASKAYQGVYRYFRDGSPVDIKISKSSVNPELTAAHEIGHFLDHQGFGQSGEYSSITDPLFSEWREAIINSNATNSLKLTLGNNPDYRLRKSAKYYLTVHEQWARSYAQWIALRSGNKNMIDQVQAILSRDPTGKYAAYQASQWSDADFVKIAEAIDNIFKKVGWLK